ncbi:hypothetical protein KP509_16G001000 [Ceratopteris richardii]|uniref:Uncharacterized protein n=1 Tax=Ceratopteris richardii TaxID=49495 RepID=A0A8T2SW70_CERRI|nr:hypothetical protein KP509_16G001000 [Ceratopteris richardii]
MAACQMTGICSSSSDHALQTKAKENYLQAPFDCHDGSSGKGGHPHLQGTTILEARMITLRFACEERERQRKVEALASNYCASEKLILTLAVVLLPALESEQHSSFRCLAGDGDKLQVFDAIGSNFTGLFSDSLHSSS